MDRMEPPIVRKAHENTAEPIPIAGASQFAGGTFAGGLSETQQMLNDAQPVRQLARASHNLQKAPIQMAAHRADVGMQVRYQGHIWTVQISAIANPQIRLIRPPNHIANIDWATADYTILRNNNAQDHDMRENDLEAAVDVYAALNAMEENSYARRRFSDAKDQALTMIKNCVRPQVNQASRASLDNLNLADFAVTMQGLALLGSGKPTEPAEWQCVWVEGQADNPRRVWTFTIDSDNPLPTSSQEPHVGWTVSARQGTQPAVGNVFGHIWLDKVPVRR